MGLFTGMLVIFICKEDVAVVMFISCTSRTGRPVEMSETVHA